MGGLGTCRSLHTALHSCEWLLMFSALKVPQMDELLYNGHSIVIIVIQW